MCWGLRGGSEGALSFFPRFGGLGRGRVPGRSVCRSVGR